MSTPNLLAFLLRAGALRTLDHAFAQSLRRLDADTPEEVLAAAALASLAVAQGHAGFDPARPQLLVDAALDWPDPASWQAAIIASRWVAQPMAAQDQAPAERPLVFEHGLLYLRRYREYERRLALQLQRIADQPLHTAGSVEVADVFALLFPPPQGTGLAAQAGSGQDRQGEGGG